MKKTAKRTTWTFEPDDDVASLIQKAIVKHGGGRAALKQKGWRTKLLNAAVRSHFSSLIGKREA